MTEGTSQASDQAATQHSGPRTKIPKLANLRVGAVIAILVAVGFVVWAIVGNGGGSSDSSSPAPTARGTSPIALSDAGLRTIAVTLGKPIYWAGRRPGVLYELRQTIDGKVYIRYLPAGVEAGDKQALPTIATYPMEDAHATTDAAAKRAGSVPISAPGGAVAFYSAGSDTNAYVAFPGGVAQIEVYDPKPGRARTLVERGAVKPVPTRAATKTVALTTPAGLKSLAASLGQPIYWAGVVPATTLELTQAPNGNIFVRYVPNGVASGSTGRYLTVATYPFANAFTATQALGNRAGMRSRELPGGGVVAFRSGAGSTSAYVAYPGQPYQIEVFDPTPRAALNRVTSGQIVPAG